MKTVRRPPYPKWNPGYFPCSSLTPLPLSSRRPSVDSGLVIGRNKKLQGIVTAWDLAEEFAELVAPFKRIGEIERTPSSAG